MSYNPNKTDDQISCKSQLQIQNRSVSHVLFLVFSPQKRRHGPCRVEHSGDHGNLGYNELRHDSGARHECYVKKA